VRTTLDMVKRRMAASEWKQYRFDVDNEHSELTTVRHVAHIPIARRIVEDGRVRSGLIYDESRLNTSRISVTWVSANTWAWGSIYGTVEFQFSWRDLVEGKHIYWVEAVPSYRPPAYRFLLSKETVASSLIQKYNPAVDDGPLKLVGGKWFWNRQFTSEFMIADDLFLEKTIDLDFITHNRDYCSGYGSACEDRKKPPQPFSTGGKFLSYILGHNIHVVDEHFKQLDSFKRTRLLDVAYSGLHLAMANAGFAGPLIKKESCEAATRGALALYGMDQAQEAHALRSLISSKKHFERSLRRVIRKHFDLPCWRPDR
jgi:hypothetical protein